MLATHQELAAQLQNVEGQLVGTVTVEVRGLSSQSRVHSLKFRELPAV